ncbi:MAG: TRAP transporter small permease [Balneolaceae bacterium]|nr:TRAP transporter small permease [Balneolaceae bacterium]
MRNTVDTVTRYVLVFLMGLLVIDVVWQVFTRYVLGSPSTFTDETARFLLIWVSLLGAAYASGQHMHLAIDVLSERLSPKNRVRLNIFIYLIIIAFVTAVLIVGGSMLVYYTYIYQQTTATLQIPIAYVYLIGPISGLLILYYKVSDIRRLLAKQPAKQS